MIVQLTDVSQGISLDDKSTQVNRLHFKTDAGKTFSIKVPSESLEELVRAIFGGVEEAVEKVAEPEEFPEPDDTESATSFGGEDTGEDASPEEAEYRQSGHTSEEDVPSL